MGCLNSSEKGNEKKQSGAIDKKLKQLEKKEQNENKLLLLGAGGSGKSTIAKQMKLINSTGFTQREKQRYHKLLIRNLIANTQSLIEASKELNLEKFDYELEGIVEEIEDYNMQTIFNKEIGNKIKKLWESENIQKVFEKHEAFHLPESAQYFFNKIDQISEDNYLPTDEDIILCRIQTTGVNQFKFESDGQHFILIDVGGQRNERKKWINHFEGVTAILFVSSLSEYNQLLYEDEDINRMEESLKLFYEQCNSRWFKEVPFILFLNKFDLFKEKIKKFPLKDLFPDYDGGDDVDKAKDFIRDKFVSKCNNEDKRIYVHYTTATDSENVKIVFAMVQDIIVNKKVSEFGVL
ncbi:guanine nucleotide-binding protein g(o) subunit alpha [Anaeramoeba flamelloides]|uniref:Guanine nucleotide-binding protein g(O) subunit alpha n=1 Tax=Anaeramoeba flamelloides TaxID=1746091 RepID=A0AAV7YVL9_9EUKA|nr:guanine nucleotide-binding protein g(o) subunit alpha [Anaeramoeba flamelloides]